jgi:signal transduction histidine kinase
VARGLMTPPVARWLSGVLVGAAAVTVVTGVVSLLEPHLPVLSLLVLYLLAVLPVAVRWGAGPAALVAVLSTLVFGYLFLPPRQRWFLADSRNAVALGVFAITAIVVANLAARFRRAMYDSARLTQEQAALRRVATLVAQGPPSDVFDAVTREVGQLCGADLARMECYDDDGSVTGVAAWTRVPVQLAVGTRFDLDGVSIARRVRQTCGPVRVDSFVDATGSIAEEARKLGIRSSVGCPIAVNGRLWGVIAASSKSEAPFAAGTETQIARFTELVATAIANAESRAQITGLLEEQAALRRVATDVARQVPPAEVFSAVADEIGRVIDADTTLVIRMDAGNMCTVVAHAGHRLEGVTVGVRSFLDPPLALGEAVRTGQPVRRSDGDDVTGEFAEAVRRVGIRSSVAMPILVGGEVWGALGVGKRSERFPADTDRRLAGFTELVATAITNADARHRLSRMATDQTALRRVATLAARGADPDRVFAAVAEEVGELMGADFTGILRFETDGTATLVGGHGFHDARTQRVGARWTPEPPSVVAAVRQEGRSVRHDEPMGGDVAETPGALPWERVRSVVASPILVEGRLWGTIGVTSRKDPLPADTEQRMADFTEIVAIAIANTENRAEVAASRARVIAASDATRRRLERDLHDGAQQRLVSLALELRQAEDAVPDELPDVRANISRAAHELTEALDELRELSRGIHPAVLSEGGLGPALRTLAKRAGVPVNVEVRTRARFPELVEVAAYYVVSEAVTNTTKHAGASHAEVVIDKLERGLWLSVRDDGTGGADPLRGSGLTGLRDRVESIGGSIQVSSPVGAGTLIEVLLPLQTA